MNKDTQTQTHTYNVREGLLYSIVCTFSGIDLFPRRSALFESAETKIVRQPAHKKAVPRRTEHNRDKSTDATVHLYQCDKETLANARARNGKTIDNSS